MLFSKKEKTKKIETVSKDDGIIVHTMPSGLMNSSVITSASSQKSSPLNAIIFVVIFLIVGGGAFFIFKDYLFPNGISFLGGSKVNTLNIPIENNNINTLPGSNEPIENTNIVINSNINNNTNSFTNVEPPKEIEGNDNTNNVNNSNTNSAIIPVYIIPHASDRDMDTMPDIEEEIYETKPGIADTDKDGFWDGQEVANLYDPNNSSSSDLRNSPLVKYYNNPTYKYQILYPASWKVVRLGGSDQEVTFVSDNKEFIEVAIMDNPNALTAVDWYLNQIPKEQASQPERIWANNFMGIKSLDGLSVYLTPISGDKNFIYSISYMLGSHTNVSFPVTFDMMVRSFDLRD